MTPTDDLGGGITYDYYKDKYYQENGSLLTDYHIDSDSGNRPNSSVSLPDKVSREVRYRQAEVAAQKEGRGREEVSRLYNNSYLSGDKIYIPDEAAKRAALRKFFIGYYAGALVGSALEMAITRGIGVGIDAITSKLSSGRTASGVLAANKMLGNLLSAVGGKLQSTRKISRLMADFEAQGGEIIPMLESQAINSSKQIVRGGFRIAGNTPQILLFEGATESVFVEEFTHFRQATLAGIKTQEQYIPWAQANRVTLENQAEAVLGALGF